MKEKWKDIPDFEGSYQISNLGNVISLERYVNHIGGKRIEKRKNLKKTLSNNGYFVVNLWKHNVKIQLLIHRLVAQSFISNPNNLSCVNHKDGNKLNNCVSNLEWCTYQENNIHALNNGLKKPYVRVNQYDLENNFIKTWSSIKEAQNFYKTSHIGECCRGLRNQTKNYIWRYADK